MSKFPHPLQKNEKPEKNHINGFFHGNVRMWQECKNLQIYLEYLLFGTVYFLYNTSATVGDFLGNRLYNLCQHVALYGLWAYSEFCVKCDDCAKDIYDKNESVRYIVDGFQTVYDQVIEFCSTAEIEPNAQYWMTLCTVQKYDEYNNHYTESLQISETPISLSNEKSFLEAIDTTKDNVIRDTILIMKSNGLYRIRLIKKNEDLDENSYIDVVDVGSPPPEQEITFEPSCFKILNAIYKHPELTESIELNVPVEMFMVGNELFSPAFVRRCLEYQSNPFVFDAQYRVDIVDSNINVITLNHTQYLQVRAKDVLLK